MATCEIRFAEERPRTKRIPDAKWEEHREVITQLYKTKKLKDVVQIMSDTYHFKATGRQFIHKLGPEHWNVVKYSKTKTNRAAVVRAQVWKTPRNTNKQHTALTKRAAELKLLDSTSTTSFDGSAQEEEDVQHTLDPDINMRIATSHDHLQAMSDIPLPFRPRPEEMKPVVFNPPNMQSWKHENACQVPWAPGSHADTSTLRKFELAADFFHAISVNRPAFQIFGGLYLHDRVAAGLHQPTHLEVTHRLLCSAVLCAQVDPEVTRARNMVVETLSPTAPAAASAYTQVRESLFFTRILHALVYDRHNDRQNAEIQIDGLVQEVVKQEQAAGEECREDHLDTVPQRQRGIGEVIDVQAYALLEYLFTAYNRVDGCTPVHVDGLLREYQLQQGIRIGYGSEQDCGGKEATCLRGSLLWCPGMLKNFLRSGALSDEAMDQPSAVSRIFCALWHWAFAQQVFPKDFPAMLKSDEGLDWIGTALPELGISASQLLLIVTWMIVDHPIPIDHGSPSIAEDETLLEKDIGRESSSSPPQTPSSLPSASSQADESMEDEFPPSLSLSSTVTVDDLCENASELIKLDSGSLLRLFLSTYIRRCRITVPGSFVSPSPALAGVDPSRLRNVVAETLGLAVRDLPAWDIP